MAATAPLMVRLDIEEMQILRLLAEGRREQPSDFASWLLHTWITGPGRRELLSRLAGAKVDTAAAPSPRPRRARQVAGQTTVDEQIAATG